MMEDFFESILEGVTVLFLVALLFLVVGGVYVLYRDVFAAPCTVPILKEVK